MSQPPIAFTNASGIHVRSISQYCLATLLNLYHTLDQQIVWARARKTWADEKEFVPEGSGGYGVRTVYGKTIGMLGYGHVRSSFTVIGRETARLFQVFGVDVIAATSSGAARPDDGYILPGTGDQEGPRPASLLCRPPLTSFRGTGRIPSQYCKTTDRASFHAFLARSDILICSVPSTNATRGLLDAEELDALLEALDKNVSGAALDVTSPEPLPPNHPLFSHPRCIITPHLSGTVENEHDEIVKLCLSSVERMERGKAPWGIVDVEKGY
ncbi:hypothetical protein QFC21_006349 [Naganishia friedmannii]|uniref:Uncharacterized protein n=1 Tax=Naganishia friedmannii TaxID=89922 RepID=A0ACC2V3C1_9TREE|nr:hypothetical protein QFC21_006349 [Naganishia friedmannii]